MCGIQLDLLVEMENDVNDVFNSECGAHSVSLALRLEAGGNSKHDFAHNSLLRKSQIADFTLISAFNYKQDIMC